MRDRYLHSKKPGLSGRWNRAVAVEYEMTAPECPDAALTTIDRH